MVVEDNSADVFLVRAAIEAARIDADFTVVKDGERATAVFDELDNDHQAPCPDLVILDINLPKKAGGEVLEHMRRSRRCARTRVIAVSTSDSARDREMMTKLGADGYFQKPSAYAEFMKLGALVEDLLKRAV